MNWSRFPDTLCDGQSMLHDARDLILFGAESKFGEKATNNGIYVNSHCSCSVRTFTNILRLGNLGILGLIISDEIKIGYRVQKLPLAIIPVGLTLST